MGLRSIKWKTGASRKNLELLLWYRSHMGERAAMNYWYPKNNHILWKRKELIGWMSLEEWHS